MNGIKKILKTILPIFLAILLGHCESEFPWKIKSKQVGGIVIDAIITNEMKAQCVNASNTNENINMPSTPVSGLTITLSDNIHEYSFSESISKPGSYYSVPFQAVVGKKYSLTISQISTVYTAQDSMVAITPLDTFNLAKDNTTGLYQYIPISGTEPTMLEVFMDWSSIPSYCSLYGHCEAQETFYKLDNLDVNKVFSPEQEIIHFPAGTKIVRRKYSLSPEHQAFLRSLLMETEWRGGLFDVQAGNVKSNISNGAWGFFGVCMVLTDSLIVK